uniref:Branchpoint-bridging protein n=1 Tax=Melanopsichium pennsylvanicum 4 TaxID=1398559 RepID=A0A077RBZ0_9BASI|nr:probable MSL5-branch point bridging protein [Melanopsichium pennsylvanicum 4]
MSWRSNTQRTGMNAQPLQGARRWGGSDAALAAAAAVAASIGLKRDRDVPSSSTTASSTVSATDPFPADGGPRKRKSRWGDAPSSTPAIPTAISSSVRPEDLDKYAIQVRLDEISTKLRTGQFIPPDRERSPSPPPTYDAQGRRTNTREVRYRKKLEDERISLVDRQLKLDPNYRPPADYHAIKRNQRPTEKVYLPIKEFPEINFFGLLVGPRGNTLKTMERQSGAKISIRGKGSVKEGKGKLGPADEEEEEMHCVVAADDEAAVKKCIRLINQVIETAASTPEGENDHKRNQLRELAALNGTLRDDENQLCKNCGNKGHRAFECPEQRNWTAHIICHRCGGQGHLARDCTQGRAGGGLNGASGPGAVPAVGGTGNRQFDSEYANLMAELGEPAAAAAAAAPASGAAATTNGDGIGGGVQVGADGKKIPPWRNPEVWIQAGFGAPRHSDAGGGAPGRGGWGSRGGGYGNRGDRGGSGGGGYGSSAPHQMYGSQPQHASYHQKHAQQQQQPAYPEYDPNSAQGGANPATATGGAIAGGEEGQKDYSAEWAAYYAAQAAYADPNAAPATTGQGGGTEGGGVDYTKEWEEYYRMQAVAAAKEGATVYGVQGQ